MKKILALLILTLCATQIKAQLSDIYINVSGGFDIVFEVEEGIFVTVTTGGEIESIDTAEMTDFQYKTDPNDPQGERLIWLINESPLEFYHPGNSSDPDTYGKVRRAANAFFEYHTPQNTPYSDLYGKMKRAGYLHMEYYTPENSDCEHKWGRIKLIGDISFDFYCSSDEVVHPDQYGLLKSVGDETYTYRLGKKGVREDAETIPVKGKRVVDTGETRVHVVKLL